jgi:hypothetical protein
MPAPGGKPAGSRLPTPRRGAAARRDIQKLEQSEAPRFDCARAAYMRCSAPTAGGGYANGALVDGAGVTGIEELMDRGARCRRSSEGEWSGSMQVLRRGSAIRSPGDTNARAKPKGAFGAP